MAVDKRKLIIFVAIAAVLCACVVGAVLLTDRSDDGRDVPQTTVGPDTTTDTVRPEETMIPTQPELPVGDPSVHRKVELVVTQADGSVAQGAAVIATDRDGRQEYGATDENGVAVLDLPEGRYSLRFLRDGQREDLELGVVGGDVRKEIRLKDDRVLYICLRASGAYTGDPGTLSGFAVLEDAIRSRYPDAVYITSEDLYDIGVRDGDALLSIEVLVENYTADDRYFAGGIIAEFRAYQESITVWDLDDAGKEIELGFIDGNMCSVRVRNEYDYEYREGTAHITGSEHVVQKDYYLSRYTVWADPLGYGYTEERVPGTSSEQRIKSPGAGMEMDSFLYDMDPTRYHDYATYVEKIFPYVDLWMSGAWNSRIEDLASLK